MKKIEFSKLAVDNLKQEEIIEWLAGATASLVKDFNDAIMNSNMGEVGLVGSQLVLVSGVAKALNESVNGKKEPTVIQ